MFGQAEQQAEVGEGDVELLRKEIKKQRKMIDRLNKKAQAL